MTRWHHPRDEHEFAVREAEMEVRQEALENIRATRLELLNERENDE